MKNNLRLTLVQSNLRWENPVANLKTFSKLLGGLKAGSTDVIMLPEMFNTGFTMNAEKFAEAKDGLTMEWMQVVASTLESIVCGSIIINDNGEYFNRFIWMQPDGKHGYYNKRHLFSMAGEGKIYSKGKERIIFQYKGWKICPMVCYDLRFPVWSRNRMMKTGSIAEPEYDLLLYVANWPAIRRYAWSSLLVARAIENQCYVAGVNRTGKDGNGISHKGGSVVLDCMGATLSKTKSATAVETVTLDMKVLTEFRKKFPVLHDGDQYYFPEDRK